MLGPEMKSTGEVLGLGRTFTEALFKGLRAAGYDLTNAFTPGKNGVLLSIENHDLPDVVRLAKKLNDLHMVLYATPDTAAVVRNLGLEVTTVNHVHDAYSLLDGGAISFIVYTGALYDDTMGDYIELHAKAVRMRVPCITSLDTAEAVADTLMSRFTNENTELVDLNNMRRSRELIHFAKMHTCGSDYIFFDNRDGRITSPESLSVTLCDRVTGIGGSALVLIENSVGADAKMRIFNQDGTEGRMAANSIRCVGKYLYDKGIVRHEHMTIQTDTGIRSLQLFTRNGRVSTVSVHMGTAFLDARRMQVNLIGVSRVIDEPVTVDGQEYRITCSSLGVPHCTVFTEDLGKVDVVAVGSALVNSGILPEGAFVEFVKVVNDDTLRIRVYAPDEGETRANGTAACAAVIAATERGTIKKARDITVKLPGGDVTVNYSDDFVTLTGDSVLVFEGVYEY